jgi:hypothetical protein
VARTRLSRQPSWSRTKLPTKTELAIDTSTEWLDIELHPLVAPKYLGADDQGEKADHPQNDGPGGALKFET